MIARPTEDTVRNLVAHYIVHPTTTKADAAVAAVAALPDETTALTVADAIQKACADCDS